MPHTLLYFLALFCLSTSPNWAKLNQMPVEILGFYRLSIAAGLLGLYLMYRQGWKFKVSADKSLFWPLLSGVFFFLHLWTYKYAAKNTSISNTMIIFSSNPIWASLGAIVFFRERYEKRLILAYMLAFAAIYLLVAEQFQLVHSFNQGDLSAVFSALFYAAYMLAGKRARQQFQNLVYAFVQYSIAALLFLVCVGWQGQAFSGYDATSWLAVGGLILMPTLLGHLSLTYLVNHMNLSLMTCGKLIEPVLASVIAFYIFNERLSAMAWFSFLLTAMAVLILFSPQLWMRIKGLKQ